MSRLMARGSTIFKRLDRNSLSLANGVALAAAAMAPVLSVVLNTPAAAPAAGAALPLAFALAFVACLFVGNTVVQFARCLPSAGSFYTFNTKGLGQTAGFLTGWLLWLGYGMFAPGMFAALGEFTRNYAATFGLTLPWWVFSVAALALILGMSLRSIKASVQTSLALLALEMAVFLALAGLVVARAGMDNSLTYFTPAAAPTGWGGVGLGMVFGILSFIGFDAAATLGEETRNPRRNVPRAVLLALLVVGLFYVFLAYAVTAGFGLEDPARLKAFADDPDPFLTLAKRNAPWLAHAVDLCAIASIFGCFLAIHNTTVRILFSMGREKVLPRFLGRVHRRWYSPYGAIAVQTVFTLSAGLGLGFWLGPGPTGAYAFAGTAGTIAVILVYGLSNVALVCFYAQRGDLHPFRHGAVPLLGTAALVYPLWASLQEQPDQTYSSLLIYLVVGGWLLLGLVLCGYFRWRAPEKLARVGTFVTEDEESLATSQWHDQEKKRATT